MTEWEEQDDQQELFEHFHFAADKGQQLLRIDKFLVNRIQNASRSKIQAAAAAGNILVNGDAVKSNYRVKPDDDISIVMAYPPREVDLIPQDIPIKIIFEDDDVIVVDKEAGLVVHPGHGNYSGTLVNALMFHLKDLPLFKSGEQRPGLVHRIDKNTSGLLVIAKNEIAMHKLAKQFFDKTTGRKYLALVWGRIDEEKGTITGNIGRSLKDRMKMAVFNDEAMGKHAVTHFRVLERFDYVTLVECVLETGRTHQIRVHFEYMGHPLFNDERYGGNQILKGTTFTKYKQFIQNCFSILPRHALHAKELEFTHPTNGKRMGFSSDTPADLSAVLDKWRIYTAGRKE
ncbi:MAG: RluA family pseudouridine synthase [Bacteroidota bacterium]